MPGVLGEDDVVVPDGVEGVGGEEVFELVSSWCLAAMKTTVNQSENLAR